MSPMRAICAQKLQLTSRRGSATVVVCWIDTGLAVMLELNPDSPPIVWRVGMKIGIKLQAFSVVERS